MPGVGVNPFGISGHVGSASGPADGHSLGPFSFLVEALSVGSDIRITLTIPALTASPDWDRNLKILRKLGAYPDGVTDTDAEVFLSKSYASIGSVTETHDDTGLKAGQIYYYSLFARRNDGVWIHDSLQDRGSAYPYDRWGSSDYMFGSQPRGWQKADADGDGHLSDFLDIFGALADNIKTDAENLLTLFEIDAIHVDLLEYLDDKIAWPTWYAVESLQRRKETSEAVDLYKLIGREAAYVQLLEEVSDWDATVAEGWRYVMFTNYKFNSITPDSTDPNTLPNIGLISDIVKYTNDNNSWHSITGLVFMMSQIPGVSGPFTSTMVSRYEELIEFAKATYVNHQLILIPTDEDDFPLTRVVDTWNHGFDVYLYSETFPSTLETDLGYTTSSVELFEAYGPSVTHTSLTNNTAYRLFHEALAYV